MTSCGPSPLGSNSVLEELSVKILAVIREEIHS